MLQPGQPRALGMWPRRGSGEDGKDTVLGRAGPWALACFVFKGERNGDRETEKQRFRDRRRDRERLRAEGEKETQRLRGAGAGEDPPPHSQGEAGGGREKGQRGGSQAASPLRPVPHQELRPGAGWVGGWGSPTGQCPHVPPPGPSQGTAPSEGAHGGAWCGHAVPLSRGGPSISACPGPSPP